MQAMTRMVICGQVAWPAAQGGNLFEFMSRGGSDLVALKMVKVAESMDRTIREQEKLTPRRRILAILTRVLIFCILGQYLSDMEDDKQAYQVLGLLLLRILLCFLEALLLLKGRAEDLRSRSAGSLESTLEWGTHQRSTGVGYARQAQIDLFHLDGCVLLVVIHVDRLALGGKVVCQWPAEGSSGS